MILTKVKNEVGATAIEYGILSALIGVATITAMQMTGVKLDNTYCYIATQISKAVGGSGGRCSATPSNPSDSHAGPGSGLSGTGGSGSNSSKDTSSDSHEEVYNTSKDNYIPYSLSESWNDLYNLLEFGVTGENSINGVYDEYGNKLTSLVDMASALGVSGNVWSAYQNAYEARITAQNAGVSGPKFLALSKAELTAQLAVQSALRSANKTIYIPDMSQASFLGKGYDGTAQTYTYPGPSNLTDPNTNESNTYYSYIKSDGGRYGLHINTQNPTNP